MAAHASEPFRLPEIRSRLPVLLHPQFEEIEHRGVSWAQAMLRFDSDADRDAFIEQAHCLWTCLLFPTGSVDRVQDICDLTLLLFATDDAFVRSPEQAAAISRRSPGRARRSARSTTARPSSAS